MSLSRATKSVSVWVSATSAPFDGKWAGFLNASSTEAQRAQCYRDPMFALLLLGCTEPEDGLDPDSSHWDVTVTAFLDECTGDTPYQESMTYSLDFDGSLVKLKIGYDAFASGTLRGCELEYESQVVGEPDRPVVRALDLGNVYFDPGSVSSNTPNTANVFGK